MATSLRHVLARPDSARSGAAAGWWPRQPRLHTLMALTLGLVCYMWLTATRTLVVGHLRITETTHLTAQQLDISSASRAARALREAGADASHSAPQQQQQQLDPEDFRRCRQAKPGVAVPRLAPVRHWRSGRERPAESVTLVTQLSLERLEMLGNQCSVWPDALAAAVYVPTVGGRIASAEDAELHGVPMAEAERRLAAFHARMEAQGACRLDLELASQDFETEEEAGLYPFNAARNRALQLARTEALLLLDADFVPAPALAEQYQTPEGYSSLLGQLLRGRALVLPAFETASGGEEGKAVAMAAVRGGKAFAVKQYEAGQLLGFQVKQYEQGHSPTNYSRWAATDKPFGVKYQKGYEPYVVAARRFVPWYDERFKGYGRDKIQHLTHLAGLNISFVVHPSAFVVHVPHRKAATFRATKASGQWDKLYQLYVEVQRDVKAHRFVPVVSWKDSHPHLCTSEPAAAAAAADKGSIGGSNGGRERRRQEQEQAVLAVRREGPGGPTGAAVRLEQL